MPKSKYKKQGIKENVGGAMGSYFGTKAYKQKLDLADKYPIKKRKKKKED